MFKRTKFFAVSLSKFSPAIYAIFFASTASATVQVSPIRPMVIDDKKETTIVVENKGDKSALVQVWPEFHETLGAYPEESKRPQFVISPPIVKLGPNKKQKVRIIYTGPNLSAERLYRLNVQEIPPSENIGSGVQFAFRHVMPLSVRIADMNDQDMENKAEQLKWTVGDNNKIAIFNSSKYVYILSSVHVNGKVVPLGDTNQLAVSPVGKTELNAVVKKGDKVEFTYFNGVHVIRDGKSTLS